MAERDVVVDFWKAIDSHDWELLSTCISDDFVRIGMDPDESDICRGKENYLRFVSGVIGKMQHHTLEMRSLFYSEDRRHAITECLETITTDGEPPLPMFFVNVHDLDEDGLISRLDIYWKTQRRMPPEWIAVETVLKEG